jgi:hypothetical protein
MNGQIFALKTMTKIYMSNQWDRVSILYYVAFFLLFILVFSSYQWQIKKLDPVTRKVTTIAGTGSAGYRDGPGLTAQVS